jgi:hypothetical protein
MLLAVLSYGFAQDYYYNETTAEKTAELVYRNFWTDNHVLVGFYIYSPFMEQAHEIFLDKEFATVQWTNTKSDGTVDVYSREGDTITADVIRNGKPRKVQREIDDSPWYASMEYGLGQFFRSGKQSVQFWNILPENLKAYKMTAEVLSTEMLDLNGVPTETLRVLVTINGIPAVFFHFMYWFRETDGFFVRFEGAKGRPGTPLTTMVFNRIE